MKNLYLSLFLIVFSVQSIASTVISRLFLDPPEPSVNILSFEDKDYIKNQLDFITVIRNKKIGRFQSLFKFQITLSNGNSHLRVIFEQTEHSLIKMHMVGVEVNDNGTPMTAVQDKKTKRITLFNPLDRKKLKDLPNKTFHRADSSFMKVSVTGLQNRTLKIDIKLGEEVESYLVDVNFGINSIDVAHLAGELNLLNFIYQ